MVGGSWIVVVHLLRGSNLMKILILSVWCEALCIHRCKPILKPSYKVARLCWARKYANWIAEDWLKVIWSDESSIVLRQKS